MKRTAPDDAAIDINFWLCLPGDLRTVITALLDEPSRVALQFVAHCMIAQNPRMVRGAIARLCQKSARHGYMALVQWSLTLNGVTPVGALGEAARGGHLELVRWMVGEHVSKNREWSPTEHTFAKAARSGNLRLVEYLYMLRCPRDNRAMTAAAAGGHVAVMKFLKDKKGIGIMGSAFDAAVEHDQTEALTWLALNAHNKFNASHVADKAVRSGSITVMAWLLNNDLLEDAEQYYEGAIIHNQPAMMRYLHASNVPWYPASLTRAAELKIAEELIDWMITAQCPCESRTLVALLRNDYVVQMKNLADAGVAPLSAELLRIAARRGDLALIDWLEARRCPRDAGVVVLALEKGHIALVKLLITERNYPRDEMLCATAATQGDLDMVQWLRGQACPWDYNTVYNAWEKRNEPLYRWVVAQGCPLWKPGEEGNWWSSFSSSSEDESDDDDSDDDSVATRTRAHQTRSRTPLGYGA